MCGLVMLNNFQLGAWSPPRTPGRPSGENLQPIQQDKEKEKEVRQTDGAGGVDSFQYGVNLRNYSWDPGSGELQPAGNGIVGTGLNNISFTHHLPQTVLACQNRQQRSQFFPLYYSRGRWRASCQRPNDLNSLPSNAADAVCSETALGIEPATPNNSRQMEKKSAYICLNEPSSQQERTEGNGNAIARVTINYDGEEQTDYHKEESILKLSQWEDLDRKGIKKFDTHKTPHQKQKRKKHRPKVIAKGKPKHIAKPASLNPTEPKEKPTEIKIYVRRKSLNKRSTLPAEEGTDFTASEPKRKYCRRAFAFDTDEQAQNGNSSSMLKCNSNSDSQAQKLHAESSQEHEQAAQMSQAMEGAMVRTTGIAHDLSLSENRNLKHYISWSERSGLAITSPKNDGPEEYVQTANYYDGIYSADQAQSIIHKESSGISEVILCANNQKTPDDSNCITVVDLCQKEQVTRLKRGYSNTLEQAQLTTSNLMGTCQNYFQSSDNMSPGKNLPKTYKKKRTGKATTSATSRVTTSLTWTNMQCMNAPCQPEWFKKKRTRGHTNVHPLALQNQIVEYMQQTPTCGNSHTCFEALVAGTHVMAKKKRTKNGKFTANTMALDTNKGKGKLHKAGIAYSHRGIFTQSQGSLGPIHKNMLSINALVGQFNNLHISGQRNKLAYEEQHALVPCNFRLQESNALVLYERNKAVVPFEGEFGPVKKHDLRPKVDLDEETNRVWRLLLENINSEGIDGIDEEKRKWWENERRVFQGRADSFVARMRLVQGDRSFSKWKGSVLDSVIGVFLTQNVSDHLSSSAFMSLAARFPSPPIRPCHESTSMWVEDPAIGILDPEDTIQLNEDKEAVNRDKSLGCSFEESTLYTSTPLEETGLIEGGKRPIDDTFLSQSSISSVNSSARRIGSCSGGNSKAEDIRIDSILSYFDAPNSFLGLLQMQEETISYDAHNDGNYNMLGSQTLECLQYGHQRQVRKRLDHPINLMGVSINHSSNYKLHTTPNSDILEVECKEVLQETQSFNILKKQNESRVGELSGLTAESISPSPVQTKVSIQEVTAESLSNQTSVQNSTAMNVQEVTAECIRKITVQNIMTVSTQEASRASNNDNPLCGDPVERSEMSEQTEETKSSVKSKTTNVKREKNQKEKEKAYNWDNLRKKAETSGRKRKRTNDTMDSLDWEAVRLADVNEISNAIKARGMNNVLAGRIKDFLNRLVGQHGSIDLEWLRDVPPDKAKEYLLSVRGLGLKSVECVRLLTLHHLAFPVDTNVGRIAVRLGWVPLQPLPESLQLHLLELYPVLESIQKYLWPRLCKLDQKALYELHYQMITFGKVFCTKSKPNCNACPLRGECRHFASAFASSRLALPGPEENRIVCATERMDEYKSFTQITSPLLLLPQANHDAEAKPEINICEPFIEEPTSPEPDCSQITECDMEDMFREDHNEIPIIELNIQKFTQNLQNYMQNNMELHEGEMSKALVALTPEVASIPVPKLKYVNRLRTEHQVYELPDSHPLVETLDEREPDDPCPYLLAIWTPGETACSIQVPKRRCNSQESGKLCNDETCLSCNSTREANSQIVRGTLLIPCRTAMRGSFPLNGTYFQVNEVFADHDSSLRPIDVPRSWIWNLTRRTVYFGTSVPSIFKGLSIEDIQHCFWKGYVCVRGFDQKTRAPRPLMARLHFPASKLSRRKDQRGDE